MVEVLSYSSSYKAVLIEELNRMIEREEKDLIQNQSKFPQKEIKQQEISKQITIFTLSKYISYENNNIIKKIKRNTKSRSLSKSKKRVSSKKPSSYQYG